LTTTVTDHGWQEEGCSSTSLTSTDPATWSYMDSTLSAAIRYLIAADSTCLCVRLPISLPVHLYAHSIVSDVQRIIGKNMHFHRFYPEASCHCPPPSIATVVLIGLYFLKCTRFDQLILRKIIKIVATRCQILTLKCTKIDFGWGSAPDPAGGAYSAPPDPLAGFKGAYF